MNKTEVGDLISFYTKGYDEQDTYPTLAIITKVISDVSWEGTCWIENRGFGHWFNGVLTYQNFSGSNPAGHKILIKHYEHKDSAILKLMLLMEIHETQKKTLKKYQRSICPPSSL